MRLNTHEHGSLTVTLLVSIVTAGLIVTLTASVMQSQQTVRFDRSFTQAVQVADAGLQDAYHRLNNQDEVSEPDFAALPIGGESAVFETSLGGDTAEWTVRRIGSRQFEVRSTGAMAADGVRRTVVARVEQPSLFFPGAFGDRLVAMNGTSTNVDSYESRTPPANCPAPSSAPDTCWGFPSGNPAGTGKGALGTNEDFDFSGNVNVSRAILYDWANNRPTPGTITATNPGGDRCKGNPCTNDVLRTENDRLEYGSDAQMQFIQDKLDVCANDASRRLPHTVLGTSAANKVLTPRSTLASDNVGSPADPGWGNFWCADHLQVNGDVRLHASATPETPVVIFLRDSYKQNKHVTVNCPQCENLNMNQETNVRSVRPRAASLQIYVLSQAPVGDVLIDTQSVFAGVIYAPRASCGSSGNAGVHVYGSMICRRIDNVGNWAFHYDDSLNDYGWGRYTIATWSEEPAGS